MVSHTGTAALQEQYGLAEQRAHGRLSGLKGRRLQRYPIPGSVLGADEKGSWEGVLKALGICEHGELILSASWPLLGILGLFHNLVSYCLLGGCCDME